MCIGANYLKGGCEFTVWAPYCSNVSLMLTEENQKLTMEKTKEGYWKLYVKSLKPGTKYMYQLNKEKIQPDPASHYQPQGVFAPSAVVNHKKYKWTDEKWQGINQENLVMYELHVGTFTSKGTFNAIIDKINELAELGITAVELMPITQFSGSRNWGYDAVFPYAVQNTYGGPEGLKELVNYCHMQGVAVFLDVIYNHLGPEGNCLHDYGPYFIEERRTPWGLGINFDGSDSLQVRKYFFENALHWFRNYHIDGLRLDAVHAIIDSSPKHFLKELSEVVNHYSKKKGKKYFLIAESNQNEPVLVRSRKQEGYGLDAMWLDDFHHALHAILTKEQISYYIDFGSLNDLAKALREGFIYSEQHSKFWRSPRGKTSKTIHPNKFVAFSQNHDQIGNRLQGERLISLAGCEAAKLAAGLVILSPFIPLLFMGEEYGEQAPFLYFTDFSDQILGKKVREGRKKEALPSSPTNEAPDPQDVETFNKSKPTWQQRNHGNGAALLNFYKELLRIRKSILSTNGGKRLRIKQSKKDKILFLHTPKTQPAYGIIVNLDPEQKKYSFPFGESQYLKILDSADANWGGPKSTLPDTAIRGGKHLAQPFNLAIYKKRGRTSLD
jgi:maltooligosyltrehalose trehalohydrolase